MALEHEALQAPRTLHVTSPSFASHRTIPRLHTSFGEDVSPTLRFSGVPGDAAALALVVDDPDAPSGTFTHWLAWDLPATLHEIPQGARIGDLGGTEGRNDFGFARYMGPKPPRGTHRYRFRVFATRAWLGLPAGVSAAALWDALANKVAAWGELEGTFTRP